MRAEPLLIVRELSANLGTKAVLHNLQLQVSAGEFIAIIGPNGAGKSSLLRALSGELEASRGEIVFQNQNLHDWPLEELARQLALLPQHSSLAFPYTVREVVELARLPHASGCVRDREIVLSALSAMDLLHLQNQVYTQLSGGEKQRTQLARVLAQIWPEETTTSLLLLDEPCNALDPGHSELLITQLRDFCQHGLSVLMVLHDINFASLHADRILVMDAGSIVASGTNRDVITADLLNNLFRAHGQVFSHPVLGHPVYL